MSQLPSSTSPIADVQLRDAHLAYRGLPDAAFVAAFLRRNLAVAVVVAAAFAPAALLVMLRTENVYESTVVLKYDPAEALEGAESGLMTSSFPAVAGFLNDRLTDEAFYLELARRYAPAVAPSPLAQLPVVGRWFAPAPVATTPEALLQRAKSLQPSLEIIADYERKIANFAELKASGGSGERAQLLAKAAGDLLLEQYYEEQTKRVEAITKTLSAILDNDRVKAMVERAVANARKEEKTSGGGRVRPESLDVLQRQKAVEERIKDLNIKLQADRERKIKLESEITALAQRYGAYHPQLKALQAQLAELNANDRSKASAAEMSRLQDQYLEYEAEAAGMGIGGRTGELETADKVVRKLGIKRDRYELELLSLQDQLSSPSKRLRLRMIGEPARPIKAAKPTRVKTAVLLAVLAAVLIVGVVLLREVLSGRARDAWTISWQLQRPCVGGLPRKAGKVFARLDPELLRTLRSQLGGGRRELRRARPLLDYRRISHWLRAGARGNVILFAKAADQPKCGALLHNLANVFACDYAGRCLVIDLDGRDPIFAPLTAGPDASVLEFLARKLAWKDVCLPRDAERAYDLVPAPAPSDRRLAELLGAPALKELVASALKIYKTVLIVGLGPEQFVENSVVLEQATDCLLVVESPTTSFAQLGRLAAHLDAGKLAGYVHVRG